MPGTIKPGPGIIHTLQMINNIVFTMRRTTKRRNSPWQVSMLCPVRDVYCYKDLDTRNEAEAQRLFPQAQIELLTQSAAFASAEASQLMRKSELLYREIKALQESLKP